MQKKNEVLSLTIKHIGETQPDLSHLEQDYSSDGITPEENKLYMEQDKKRLREYDAGYWHMMGIIAEAVVKVHVGKSYLIGKVSSSGIWGIESDAPKEYIKEHEQEQLTELRKELADMNMEIPENMTVEVKETLE